jgi:hypothetical protein
MGVSFDPRCKRKPYTAYHYCLAKKQKKNLGTYATETEALAAFHAYLVEQGIPLPEVHKPKTLQFGVIK